ncbi:type II toxin-antitoxin system VapC family toxin [Endozoicomonas numazuensis]|nr:type II toxin-antitoxin system VapC family toxin [Endozoicomonas numazuensis]
MLDTCICSFIMREQPIAVLQQLENKVKEQSRIVISAITYAEMQFGCIGKKASPKHQVLVDAFLQRIDAVLPWDRQAIDATALIKKALTEKGTLIDANDTAIAGHSIATNSVLVTNNIREFKRVPDLMFEDWVQ